MLLNVKVKPNAKESRIEKINDSYVVYVKASPQDNKANIEVVKLLKKYFSKDVIIVRGLKSKNKIVEVKD
jgi:uncharacterized protein (TIGR00251 family)